MTAQVYEKLGWDEPTQTILRTLSRGDLSILQGAVAHSRGELDGQKPETENGYFKLEGMIFKTGKGTPISYLYAHFVSRGWMKSLPVDPELLKMMPDSVDYDLTEKGRRLLGQLIAYFVANNTLPRAPVGMKLDTSSE